jgi:hypothetical protein
VQEVAANNSGQKVQTLHCEIGNHSWERPSARGVKPHNCPEHKPVGNLIDPAAGTLMRVLHCEIGNHDWTRPPTRGRVPINCPEHKASTGPLTDNLAHNEVLLSEYPNGDAMVLILDDTFYSELPKVEAPKRAPGRPRIHETKEQQEQAALEKSRAKVDVLESNLKAHGTHISQQAPYQLYKLVSGIAGEESAKYDYVRDFSPLAKSQFQNQFPDRFNSEVYFFKRDGVRLANDED